MINVSNNYKQALTQPRTIDAKITYDSTTINIDNINSIKRSFNSTLFKTIAKQVIIDSNVSIDKDKTINPQFGLYLDNQFEYVSLGSYKTKDAPNLNKDTNSYEITAYDKIVDSMVDYGLTNSDITYPCTVRQLFVAIFTKLGWSTSGIPATFVNSTSMIEEDVYSNVNFTYRDVLDELCTISCMFLIDVNGTPTLKQKTTTSETINEDFMSDTNVQIKNQVFFNSLVFSRASESDNIYRKDDTSIANNGLHEFKVSDLQILSLNWRDNFIDAMWNYIKTFTYYAYEVNTGGITYLEPIDTFTLSTFGSTYSTILLNSDLTIANGVNEKIYANEPLESETEYKYADTTDKRINQTNLIVDKQNGKIDAVVSQVDEIEEELSSPTSIKEDKYFDLEDALDSPLIDFSLYGETQQDSTTGKNLFQIPNTQTLNGITLTKNTDGTFNLKGTATANTTMYLAVNLNDTKIQNGTYTISRKSTGYNTQIDFYNGNSWLATSIYVYGNNLKATSNVTIPNNATMVRFIIYVPNGTTINLTNEYVQIETGSSQTSWEKYSGGIPAPNPDYPQEIHNVSGDNTIEICGKNLFDKEAITENKYLDINGVEQNDNTKCYSDYIAINSNNNYITNQMGNWGGICTCYYNANKTFISAETGTTIVSNNNIFTIPSNAYYMRVSTSKSWLDIIQIEKGSTSSEYEAYTGNSQLISLGVENLFDGELEQGSYDNGTGAKQTNNNLYRNSTYLAVQPNTTYTLSINGVSQKYVLLYYKSDKTFISVNTGLTTGTFTTPNNCYYINFRCFAADYTSDYANLKVQLEKGSKANSYSPYGKTPIELNKISTYQDYIYKDNDRWFLHKEIGKKVFNGSENWQKYGAYGQAYLYYVDNETDGITLDENKVGYGYALCNNFTWDSKGNNTAIAPYIRYQWQNGKRIYVGYESDLTLANFKTWLSTHNTIVNYVLATPTDTEITDTTLIGQLDRLMTLPLYKNMTHITLTPNNLQPTMKIEYYRDTSLNNSYVPKTEMNKYYTKTETIAQIQIGNSSIQQSVAEMQTTLDSTNNSINTISNQVQTLQTSTSQQINVINEQLENGVSKVKTTTGFTFDEQGLGITKGEEFKNLMTDRNQVITSGGKEQLFIGYDDNEKRTVARIPTLESQQATIGVHRTEVITRKKKKRTAGFYVGGGN